MKTPNLLTLTTLVVMGASIFLGLPSANIALADGVPNTKAAVALPVDLCGPPQGALPPDYEGYPSQLPEDTGGTTTAKRTDPPKSANPVRKVCENGTIDIRVGSPRNYGFRTLDLISVTIIIESAPDYRFDYSSLRQKTLAFDGSDFYLFGEAADSVFISETTLPSGKVERRINVLLQSSVVDKDNLVFQLNLRYATKLGPDGKTPEWKVLVTPDFVISRSKTLDTSDELLESDMSYRPQRTPIPAYPLAILGFVLVFSVPAFFLVQHINRVRRRKVLPPKAAAWAVFEAVFKASKTGDGEGDYLFDKKACHAIVVALRRYLAATNPMIPVESATVLEIQDALAEHPAIVLILRILNLCEDAIYLNKEVTAAESKEIVEAIETLVPEPWEKQ